MLYSDKHFDVPVPVGVAIIEIALEARFQSHLEFVVLQRELKNWYHGVAKS